mmetsp:Transcript_4771/g.13161  ORF Transcript_4771/g.13161 Transcript_4771/m.13161 type:complete len:82 (+) Transcript_4771:617-862(+)
MWPNLWPPREIASGSNSPVLITASRMSKRPCRWVLCKPRKFPLGWLNMRAGFLKKVFRPSPAMQGSTYNMAKINNQTQRRT